MSSCSFKTGYRPFIKRGEFYRRYGRCICKSCHGIGAVGLLMLVLSVPSLSAQRGFHIRNTVVVENKGADLRKLVLILPLPQTNEYQRVENLSFLKGEKLDIPATADVYLRVVETRDFPAAGKTEEIYYDFDIALHPERTDFSRIDTLYPYDENSDIYSRYTGNSGKIVDTQDEEIRRVGDSVWMQSDNPLDYARRCYEFVGVTYSYKNPNTGLHPLRKILEDKGGDCGNLSSVFVSLLRYRHIPSRHIVTVRPNGETHVWADFYLEKHGWIPVDVTMKNSDPSGDYFGYCAGDGIVFTRGVDLDMEIEPGNSVKCPLLQTFCYWYWCESDKGAVCVSHHLEASER